jgi:hypothetical protein
LRFADFGNQVIVVHEFELEERHVG